MQSIHLMNLFNVINQYKQSLFKQDIGRQNQQYLLAGKTLRTFKIMYKCTCV